ncbi:alpha/beta hydrolase family protein [Noviherbaspirillum galbum]|uniref:Prolyl oligopeptidase family serine peptidase n=1 Tax=Noviherbaspirillum galbum TaxID=2709383 RepID=A0A6B3SVK5_9BURK|nr:alpha/beta fold hydrolase [Noviherbaspirillum galbum]NEX64853.1 prolyl oligopeptidase family serine peptidase [Noviherbaspirillum galbum]
MRTCLFFLGRFAAACLALSLATGAAADAIPAEAFFNHPAIDNAALSPNGRYLAIQMARKDGRVMLATMEIATRKLQPVANYKDVDVAEFHWINDDQLVYSGTDFQSAQGEYRFTNGNLMTVQRDGSGFKALKGGRFYRASALQDSSDIYVNWAEFTTKWDVDRINLARLNTANGELKTFTRPGKTIGWWMDGQNVPRVSRTLDQARISLYYKDDAAADSAWRKISEGEQYSGEVVLPQFIGPDGTLYVTARKGKDKSSLYTFDVKTSRLGSEPVITLADYDFHGQFVADGKTLLGVHVETDAPATVWFDERMKRVQKEVDERLPGTVNRLSSSVRNETSWILVRAFSDVQPASFYLYDTEARKLDLIGKAHPAIDPARMSTMDMIRYPARDGLPIPAYLTLPASKDAKNLPLVVLVHGGPWVRGGHWQWNPEVQFLASRGYAVIQPEFRGSTGYGFRHFQAGWKQWGQAMQDDLADAAKWAIEKGIADPKRICIAGASYGGYATLMGLIKDPELFRCGVNWVGVTDIDLMYSATWSDSSEDWRRYGIPFLIGDREKDAEMLKNFSPVRQASRLKRPLLMAYGVNDRRVPIEHGVAMRDALKASNPDLEWIEFQGEGHGWKLEKNQVEFWTRVETFLDKHIGH